MDGAPAGTFARNVVEALGVHVSGAGAIGFVPASGGRFLADSTFSVRVGLDNHDTRIGGRLRVARGRPSRGRPRCFRPRQPTRSCCGNMRSVEGDAN